MDKIGIVGLGYVGLPLAIQFARSDVAVVGLDIDQKKVDAINRGESYIKSIDSKDVAELERKNYLSATTDFSEIRDLSAILICVPTPLGKHWEPDISYILDTAKAIAPHLTKGILVVLESTTYPGTTEEDLREALEKHSNGFKAGEDFYLAYSPEREDPGNPNCEAAAIPKVVGGLTETCKSKAVELYSKSFRQTVPVSCCKVAEATKLLENIFRSVNIALVNELKVVYDAMGIDIWEVIDAAKSKPFGYMPFYPGPGLGGHCIPIDPFYLTWKAKEFGQHTRFIELAGEINTSMPNYVIQRVAETLNDKGKSVRGAKILIIGVAYKANVDDQRQSPSFLLMNRLREKGAHVAYYDPHVPVIQQNREHPLWDGAESIEWTEKTISEFDLSLVSTNHDAVDYVELVNWSKVVIDTRNVVVPEPSEVGQKVFRA